MCPMNQVQTQYDMFLSYHHLILDYEGTQELLSLFLKKEYYDNALQLYHVIHIKKKKFYGDIF